MAAVNSSTIHTASSKSRITSYRKSSFTSPSSSFLKVPTRYLTKCPPHALTAGSPPHHHPMRSSSISANPSPSSSAESAALTTAFQGLCYVVGDNIDTDQIIPTEYLTLVPSVREDKKKLGSYALCGLPSSYSTRFVEENEYNSKYSIVIAGANFGCGSSREHAPAAIGAAGAPVVVAESYARIFFRNSVATGEVYPLESQVRICEECKTGDAITIELAENKLINHTSGKQYQLKSVGDVGPVIESGGIFAYARDTGMLPSQSPA